MNNDECQCLIFKGDSDGWCPVHGNVRSKKSPLKRKVATLQLKEKLWETIGAHPVSPNFFWKTSDEQILHPKNMRTFHLFGALQLVWNHVKGWSSHIKYPYTRRIGRLHQIAVANLFNELMNRPDRTDFMEQKLREIAQSVVQKKSRKT